MNAIAESLVKESFISEARRDREARIQAGEKFTQDNARYVQTVGNLLAQHLQNIPRGHTEELATRFAELQAILNTATASSPQAFQFAREYVLDASQRWVLYVDALRQRGNAYLAHEAAGCPPVLAYDFEVIVDGRQLARPVNYSLVRIIPPEGTLVREDGRPYVIIDPRAGHGSGIGGFKSQSEVGVALANGHPVYFVIFRPQPEPGQTLTDVCAAEAHFVREVIARHPDAPRPIIVGNCQGGWAVMLLAASNPDITGPLVLNGAPLSYWAGARGNNPLRYMGGLSGGALPALIISDLGAGKFDGAHLVLNFEGLNPAATWWRKYYDLYSKADTEIPRFLEFERWWSGFYFMNTAEIGWILEDLFIGNKLPRGRARFDDGGAIDLRNIRSPIIVFASEGDNITPPPQALNWIADLYSDVRQIKLRGQRILYTLHSGIGHLGIFVSAKIAQKEHQEIGSTLKSIEALAPGLYELVITDITSDGASPLYSVSFEERTIADLVALYDDGREDEQQFKSVARLSELATDLYDLSLRPFVQAMATPEAAAMLFESHPLRQRRYILSDKNPGLWGVPALAANVRENRKPAAEDNPFIRLERFNAGLIEQGFNLFRDVRDAWYEVIFHGIYSLPMMHRVTEHESLRRGIDRDEDLRHKPEVLEVLSRTDQGQFPEAVIRMLVLMAQARGSVRRSRLERSNAILRSREPFASLASETRARIIFEQSLIVDLEPERALATLPKLLSDSDQRERAAALIEEIAGPLEEMNEPTLMMLEELKTILDVGAAQAPSQASSRRRRSGTQTVEAIS